MKGLLEMKPYSILQPRNYRNLAIYSHETSQDKLSEA